MKALKIAALALFALICAGRASAQFPCTTSPNVGFQIPNIGNQTNWGTCLNTDLNMLDVLLGGTNTLTVSSLTPSVAGSTNWLTANTSPVAITNFTGGFPGQSIHVLCGVGDDFTNIPGSANIVVSGAWSCASSESISFTLIGTTWIENGRAGGGSAALNIQLAGVPQGTAATINFSTNTSVSISGGVATVTASTTAATAFSALTASSNPNAGTFAASGNSWDFSATNGFLLPTIGNGALKPGASADDIQFVSNNGNDSNDGRSWGSAKLTNAAACAALPSGNSSCTAGKGTVLIAPGFTGSVLASGAAGVAIVSGYNSFSGIPAILVSAGPMNFTQSGLPCSFGSPSGINWQVCVNGTDLQWEHPGAGGNGRFHVDSDFLVGPPGSATSGGNFNSFAWDNEGSYFDGTEAQNNLWEHAVSTTPATGGVINSRLNIWPLFTGTCTGCTADLALGASGVNPGQGNLTGAAMWDFIILPRDGFTATFTHAFTANHAFAFPDVGGTIALVNAPQTFTSLMQFTAGAQSNFFSSSSANPAASGILRCASGDPCAVWRNNANSGDIALSKDTSDNLNFSGLIVAPLASGFVSGDCGEPTNTAGKWTTVDAGNVCGSGGGGLTGQTVHGIPIAATATTSTSSSTVPSAPGQYAFGYTIACGSFTPVNPTVTQIGSVPRDVTASSDTIVCTDNFNPIIYDGSVAVVVSLPTPTTLGNSGFSVPVINHTSGSATDVTITAAGSLTFDRTGTATLVIHQGQQYRITADANGTTWDTVSGDESFASGTGLSISHGQFGPTVSLASQSANTVLGSLTATISSGLPVPSCSGAANALTWTSGTGFGCNTISSGAATALVDTNALNEITTTATGSAVNFFNVTNAATGNPPIFASTGSDTNVGFNFNNKGTGAVAFGWNGSNYLTMSSAGALTIANSTTGQNIAINPASNSSVITTLLGTGFFKVKGSSTASDNVGVIEFGVAAPTGDALEIQNSSAVAMASIGPSGIVQSAGTQIVSGADYTNSTVTPSTVFSWTLPPTVSAKTYRYSCTGLWESTNTTLVGPVFGVSISAAPTQLTALASVQNTLAGADVNGYLSNTTTGSQTVVTGGAAGVTSTNYWFTISGTIEGAPTAGSTFIINAASTSGTTATLNIRRGSSCHLQ